MVELKKIATEQRNPNTTHIDTLSTVDMVRLINQEDKKGVISSITQLLAWQGINVALMRLTRSAKGKTATSLIETDDVLPITLKDLFLQLDGIKDVRILNFGVEEE